MALAKSDSKKNQQNQIQLTPTKLPHVFLCDIDDSGLLKEILVVKKFDDGTIYYVDIQPLHVVDKSRIKKIVSSEHADKYECWELLAQNRLSNGINALDFFHTNSVKIKRPLGAKSSTVGLNDIEAYGEDKMIGSDFADPTEVIVDHK